MKINSIAKYSGTFLGTGFFPIAPGTFTSAAALLVYYLVPGSENGFILLAAIILTAAVGIPLGSKFEKVYGKDPSCFTLDEAVGMWISLLFLPKNIWLMIAAFFLWRIADIIKPYPANISESLKGGLGIMMDDVISAVYTLIIMQIAYFLLS